MKLWTLPFRFLGILALALLVSGVWLFRKDVLRLVRCGNVQPEPRRRRAPRGWRGLRRWPGRETR